MLKKPLISICITSYNSPEELIRLIKSIDSKKYLNSIEVIIAEDKSPKRAEIKANIEKFKLTSPLTIVDVYNSANLGYDRNLGNLIHKANAPYILFMSDDDVFIPGTLDLYLDVLFKENPSLAYSPFISGFVHRKYKKTIAFQSGYANAASHISDAILFSGLTFKKDNVINIDSEKFLNTNYFQVYLFLVVFSLYGAVYIDIPLVDCKSDGENGFGLSETSEKNVLLANRKSPISMLQFHKGLIKVIKTFDSNYSVDVTSIFAKQYSLRSYYHLSRARHAGKEYYAIAKKMYKNAGVKLYPIYYVYVVMIEIFGVKISDWIMKGPRKLLILYNKRAKR